MGGRGGGHRRVEDAGGADGSGGRGARTDGGGGGHGRVGEAGGADGWREARSMAEKGRRMGVPSACTREARDARYTDGSRSLEDRARNEKPI